MKKYPIYIFACLAAVTILTSCGKGDAGHSLVTLTIGGDGRTASLKAEDDTVFAQAGRWLKKVAAPQTAVAAIPSTVYKVIFSISGPDMETITRAALVSGQTSISETFEVPSGDGRHFLVKAADSYGTVVYRGDAFVDLSGVPVILDIEMQPVVFAGTSQFGTSEEDEAYGIAVDIGGNIYVAGSTEGRLSGNVNAGYSDIFVAKVNPSREIEWVRQFGTPGFDYAYGIAVDGNRNVYVVGSAGGGLDGNSSAGGVDSFITKFDTYGNKQWLVQLGSAGDDFGRGIALDGSGNLYVTGYTGGGLDGNANSGGYDIFIAKYGSDGAKQWVKQSGTPSDDYGAGIAAGIANVYITGYTKGGLDGNTNSGRSDIFMAQYDPAGVRQWTVQLGTADDDEASGITVDGSGNIYVTGGTYAGLDGNSSGGGYDLFLAKYNATGSKQWVRQLGTVGNDYAFGVGVDLSGNAFVVGETSGGLDGNTSSGVYDIFVAKYDALGNKQFTRQTGTSANDYGKGLAMDVSGDMYITGHTLGSFDGNTNTGGYDSFIVKYNPSGVKQ